jgi:hypothetical protein
MKQQLPHWIPAIFCAFISLMALFGSSVVDSNWWQSTFLAFLPMCFFFVAIVTSSMYRQILQLRKELSELRAKR